jgi:hypothetical protein
MNDMKKTIRKMENFKEEISIFLRRKEKNVWENYDLLSMCKMLHPFIIYQLSVHGQYMEEFFVRSNLKIRFSHLTFEDIDNGYEHVDKTFIDENGNEVYQILHPLPIYKKFEAMLYHELNKKYANDPDLLNLKEISDGMSKIINNKGKGFSKEEMIEIIDRSLHSKCPGGPIWIICNRENELDNKEK